MDVFSRGVVEIDTLFPLWGSEHEPRLRPWLCSCPCPCPSPSRWVRLSHGLSFCPCITTSEPGTTFLLHRLGNGSTGAQVVWGWEDKRRGSHALSSSPTQSSAGSLPWSMRVSPSSENPLLCPHPSSVCMCICPQCQVCVRPTLPLPHGQSQTHKAGVIQGPQQAAHPALTFRISSTTSVCTSPCTGSPLTCVMRSP